MLHASKTMLVALGSLALNIIALPVLNPRFKHHANAASKHLISRSEEPQQMCKRVVLCGGGGGDFGVGGDFDGGGDFGAGGDFTPGQADPISSSSSDPIDIPTVEITGHRDDSPSPGPEVGPGGVDPQLVAMNEEKGSGGLSVHCALESAVAGWEAGLACSLLEEKYGKPSAPAPAPPKTPSPPKAPAPAPAPPPPAPKAPAPASAPNENNSGGSRGVGRPGMVPRWIHVLFVAQNQ